MQKIMFKNTKKNFTPLPTETREHLINNYHLIYYLSSLRLTAVIQLSWMDQTRGETKTVLGLNLAF